MITSSSIDSSTNDILDWLYYLKPNHEPKRMNDYLMPQCRLSVELSNDTVAERIWYRRGSMLQQAKPEKSLPGNAFDRAALQVIDRIFGLENNFAE